ncbi:thioredoxin domain-containing protein 17-like isoform X1 [Leptidea sinapis]|uniref:thioredoxin domain-containing protein 17-like isoform X1 n=1 Tax=Leptidea sinapis TaxID=189913 RepID=UPI002138EC52|nr:thioredoxin domain-containing protein 17-like isoform X1 [Leptidea sinapis]
MTKIKIIELKNYDEFTLYIDKLTDKKSKNLYFFFTGSNKENGRSWCIYCQMAEPVIKSYFTELQKNIIFVYVDVGDRDYWKNKACPFRTDSRIKLMVIPTLIKWKGVQRLEGSQCNKRELLQMLFEDDE